MAIERLEAYKRVIFAILEVLQEVPSSRISEHLHRELVESIGRLDDRALLEEMLVESIENLIKRFDGPTPEERRGLMRLKNELHVRLGIPLKELE